MTAAAGLASVFSALFAWRPARPLEAGPDDLALLALFGAAQLGLGLVLFTAGARLIPVAEASLIAVLESVLGPVWVWLALGETPAPAALVGGAIILAALVVHTALEQRETGALIPRRYFSPARSYSVAIRRKPGLEKSAENSASSVPACLAPLPERELQ